MGGPAAGLVDLQVLPGLSRLHPGAGPSNALHVGTQADRSHLPLATGDDRYLRDVIRELKGEAVATAVRQVENSRDRVNPAETFLTGLGNDQAAVEALE